jgi:molybdopterin/thiamine biosynthesis adenylyltransferase/rhodanese-related sulfurtransferase
MSRYARQMILLEVGAAGQERLARAHVLVVGAGGLGCPVLAYLGGAGIGRLTVIDPDVVEESNLHRQPLYTMADIARPKAEAAAERLVAANPGLRVTARHAPLGPDTAPGLCAAADLVIDAADSYAVSYILSDVCRDLGRPLVSASVLGQAGYAGAFCGGAPSLRAVFPEPPDSGATCASAGVLGPVVGMIGSLQAQMALQILLGAAPAPLGRMLRYDARLHSFGSFDFSGAPEPEAAFPYISPAAVTAADQVIELRPEAEAPQAAAAGAQRVAPEALADLALEPGRRVVLCCQTGLRAWRAAAALQTRGYSDIALIAAGAA